MKTFFRNNDLPKDKQMVTIYYFRLTSCRKITKRNTGEGESDLCHQMPNDLGDSKSFKYMLRTPQYLRANKI